MCFRDESSNSINIYRGYSQNLLVLVIFAIIVYPEQWCHLFARNIHEFPDDMNITSNVIDCYIRRFYSFFVCIYDDQTSVYYLSSMKYSQPIFITSRLALLWHNAASVDRLTVLKHITTLFSLSDYYILSREWRVTVDQVQINYHGRPNGTIISQV